MKLVGVNSKGVPSAYRRSSYEPLYSVPSGPILGANGTVYIGAKDFAPAGSVYALNPDTGATLWSYTTGNIIQSTPAMGADGTLYIGSYDNDLYAFGPSIPFTPTNFIYLPLILK